MAMRMQQKAPNKNYSIFKNFNHHLHYITGKYVDQYSAFKTATDAEKEKIFNNEIESQLTMFKPLKDGYDYMDEMMGATVVPLLAGVAAVACLVAATCYGLSELAVRAGVVRGQKGDNGNKALDALFYAAVSVLIAVSSFLKSAVSLFTRPFVTLYEGWDKNQDEVRFYDMDATFAPS